MQSRQSLLLLQFTANPDVGTGIAVGSFE